jgi:hypothetical protein
LRIHRARYNGGAIGDLGPVSLLGVVIDPKISSFGETARGLAHNPLGIIALFIVLVYAIASLVVGFVPRLDAASRTPLIWFMVLFPTLVFIVFAWLVSQHYEKLYSPKDWGEREFLMSLMILKSEATQTSPELLGQIIKNMDPRAHNADETAPVEVTDPTVTEDAVDETPGYQVQERSELVNVLAAMTSVQEE